MTEPKFSDEEMRAILRDAAEWSTDDDARHSLADIVRVASPQGDVGEALLRVGVDIVARGISRTDDWSRRLAVPGDQKWSTGTLAPTRVVHTDD